MEPEGGQVPGRRSLEDLAPQYPLARRPNGGNFTTHDSGSVGDRVVTFGTADGVRMLREASDRGADWAIKVPAMLQAQLHTARASTQGYVLPFVCALRPNKTGSTYQKMWSRERDAVGAAAADQRACGN